ATEGQRGRMAVGVAARVSRAPAGRAAVGRQGARDEQVAGSGFADDDGGRGLETVRPMSCGASGGGVASQLLAGYTSDSRRSRG
ncbi:MAG: hypothetical protein M3R07_00405, partial [Gemmatimonadota bacterium]|nr:hypothetical protein [Gemmatimonadota bacterium]